MWLVNWGKCSIASAALACWCGGSGCRYDDGVLSVRSICASSQDGKIGMLRVRFARSSLIEDACYEPGPTSCELVTGTAGYQEVWTDGTFKERVSEQRCDSYEQLLEPGFRKLPQDAICEFEYEGRSLKLAQADDYDYFLELSAGALGPDEVCFAYRDWGESS